MNQRVAFFALAVLSMGTACSNPVAHAMTQQALLQAAARIDARLQVATKRILQHFANDQAAQDAFLTLHTPVWQESKKAPKHYLSRVGRMHLRLAKRVPIAKKDLDVFTGLVRKKYGVNWKKVAAIAFGVAASIAVAGVAGVALHKRYKQRAASDDLAVIDKDDALLIAAEKDAQAPIAVHAVARLRGKLLQEDEMLRPYIVSADKPNFAQHAARVVGQVGEEIASSNNAFAIIGALSSCGYTFKTDAQRFSLVFISPESDGENRHVLKIANAKKQDDLRAAGTGGRDAPSYVDRHWQSNGYPLRESRSRRTQVRRVLSANRINKAGFEHVRAIECYLIPRPGGNPTGSINDKNYIVVEKYMPEAATGYGPSSLAHLSAGRDTQDKMYNELIDASHIMRSQDLKLGDGANVYRGADGKLYITDTEAVTATAPTIFDTALVLGEGDRELDRPVEPHGSAVIRAKALQEKLRVLIQQHGYQKVKEPFKVREGLNNRQMQLLHDKGVIHMIPGEIALFDKQPAQRGWHWTYPALTPREH